MSVFWDDPSSSFAFDPSAEFETDDELQKKEEENTYIYPTGLTCRVSSHREEKKQNKTKKQNKKTHRYRRDITITIRQRIDLECEAEFLLR